MSVDDARWAEIRRLYETGGETFASLARRFAVSPRTIARRASRDGWQRPTAAPDGRPRAAGRQRDRQRQPTTASTTTTKDAEPAPPGVLVRRLFRAIEIKIDRLEARMRSGNEPSAADSERETRELGSMIRSFEKMTECATAIAQRETPSGDGRKPAAAPVTAADAERMRQEIAERLERILAADAAGWAQGEAGPAPGEPPAR